MSTRARRARPGAAGATRLGMRSRRGTLVMIVGVLFLGLVAVSGLTADLSRLGVVRAELQVSADAGVHAGMVQYLINPLATGAIIDSTEKYAKYNLVMRDTATVDQNETGVWDGSTRTFNPSAPPPHNAVRIQLSFETQGLIMGVLGIPAPVIHASAIGTTATFPSPPAICSPPAPSCQHPVIVK